MLHFIYLCYNDPTEKVATQASKAYNYNDNSLYTYMEDDRPEEFIYTEPQTLEADLREAIDSGIDKQITAVQISTHEHYGKIVRALPAFRALIRDQYPKMERCDVIELSFQKLHEARDQLYSQQNWVIAQLQILRQYRYDCLANWMEGNDPDDIILVSPLEENQSQS